MRNIKMRNYRICDEYLSMHPTLLNSDMTQVDYVELFLWVSEISIDLREDLVTLY